jgi:hypothetical protein
MSLIHILLLSLISISIAKERLVFVATHFRHGARAPQGYLDPVNRLDYALESWDNPGELTGMGQRMHYLLGLRNRERYITKIYNGFLKEKFDPHEILIYSSSLNRTLLSAASQLQGLFPMSEGLGEKLDKEQREKAIPNVDLSSDVKAQMNTLGDQALPNYMTLAPVRMISPLEKKIIIYDIPNCLFRRDEMREKNYKTSKNLNKTVQQFLDDYKAKLEPIYKKYNIKDYDIHFIDNFCDGFIAGSTEGKKLEPFDGIDVTKQELLDYCYNFSASNFRDWISGDENRTLATLEVSKLMRDFINYMNLRVNDDINGTDSSINKKDYSKPKMMMISGHDSTISTIEMFFIKVFFNNNDSYYRYPYFATQVALEVTIDESIGKDDKKRENYNVTFYFDDEPIFSRKIDDFINAVTPHLWSDDQIDEYCHFVEKKEEEGKGVYFYLTIAFSCTTAIFLIVMIIMIIKNCRGKTSESINNSGLLLKNYE